jgi:hypothetical protein
VDDFAQPPRSHDGPRPPASAEGFLRHLDVWDAALVVAGVVVGVSIAVVASFTPWSAAKVGMFLAFAMIGVRRRLDPSLMVKEQGPPPPPMTFAAILLVSLAMFALLAAAFSLVFVFNAMSNPLTSMVHDTTPLVVFSIVCVLVSFALIRLARRGTRATART